MKAKDTCDLSGQAVNLTVLKIDSSSEEHQKPLRLTSIKKDTAVNEQEQYIYQYLALQMFLFYHHEKVSHM